MKKWISLFVACMLGFCMPLISFAEEVENRTEEEQIFLEKLEELELKYKREYEEMLETYGPNPEELLKETLSEEEYGGYYWKGDVLHVVPIDKETETAEEAVSSISGKSRQASRIVVDEPVKYSLAELSEANDRLFDQFEELYFEYGISSFSMDEEINGIIIYCANPWTEEMKQKVLDIAGIESIEFSKLETTSGSDIEFDPSEIPPADPLLQELLELQPKGSVIARSGSRLFDNDITINGARLTSILGCTIKSRNGTDPYGFLTTAHAGKDFYTVSKGDIFKCEDAYSRQEANLGQVGDVQYPLDFDVALIPYNRSHLEATPSVTTIHNLPISSSREPKKDQYVYVLGSSGLKGGKVINVSYSASWNTDVGFVPFRNLIRIEFPEGKTPTDGDSGSAVCLISPDERSYQIIGIYKGREGDTNMGCATRFDKIKEKYNVDVYTR